MSEKTTIQIRIDRKLHKQLKIKATENGTTITSLASDIIGDMLATNLAADEID